MLTNWVLRVLFGESAEEYFARNPHERIFVNSEGAAFSNPRHTARIIRAYFRRGD